MLEDFVYWGLSLMVREPEGGKSHATAFEVGLTLVENKYVYQDIERTMSGHGRGREGNCGLTERKQGLYLAQIRRGWSGRYQQIYHRLQRSRNRLEPLQDRPCSRPSRWY